MGFSQAHTSIDEEGIVILGRQIGNRQGGGMGKLITRPHHVGIKGVVGVQAVFFDGMPHRTGNRDSLSPLRLFHLLFSSLFKQEVDRVMLIGEMKEGFPNQILVVLRDPILEKLIGNLQFNLIFTQSDQIQRFQPDIVGLLADLFPNIG